MTTPTKTPSLQDAASRYSGLQVLGSRSPELLGYGILTESPIYYPSLSGDCMGIGIWAHSSSKARVGLSCPAEHPVGYVLDPHLIDVNTRAVLSCVVMVTWYSSLGPNSKTNWLSQAVLYVSK